MSMLSTRRMVVVPSPSILVRVYWTGYGSRALKPGLSGKSPSEGMAAAEDSAMKLVENTAVRWLMSFMVI